MNQTDKGPEGNEEVCLGLESLTQHQTSRTVCLHLYSDGSSIFYSTVTFNYDLLTPKFNAFICLIIRHWCKFGENLTNTFQDIVLTRPETAVSRAHFFHHDLDLSTSNCEAFTFVPLCIADASMVLTMFRDAHTDGRTHARTHRRAGQKQNDSGHTMLGRGITKTVVVLEVVEVAVVFTFQESTQ